MLTKTEVFCGFFLSYYKKKQKLHSDCVLCKSHRFKTANIKIFYLQIHSIEASNKRPVINVKAKFYIWKMDLALLYCYN